MPCVYPPTARAARAAMALSKLSGDEVALLKGRQPWATGADAGAAAAAEG